MPIQIGFWPMRAIQLVQKKKAKLEGGVREKVNSDINLETPPINVVLC